MMSTHSTTLLFRPISPFTLSSNCPLRESRSAVILVYEPQHSGFRSRDLHALCRASEVSQTASQLFEKPSRKWLDTGPMI